MPEKYTKFRDLPLATRKDGHLTVRAEKFLNDMTFTYDDLSKRIEEANTQKDTEMLAFIGGFAVAVILSDPEDKRGVRQSSTDLLAQCMHHIREIDK